MIEGFRPPCVHFRTRVRDESIEGPNPYRWETVTSDSIFKNRRVVLFSLPGAFTPTCSGEELPSYDRNYNKFIEDRDDRIDYSKKFDVLDEFKSNLIFLSVVWDRTTPPWVFLLRGIWTIEPTGMIFENLYVKLSWIWPKGITW